MLKQGLAAFCAANFAVLTSPSFVQAQTTYSYTLIAVTGGASPFSGVYAPSLNAAGTVAFGANLAAGGSGVFIGAGGATTTIAQTGPTFSGFSDSTGAILPAINPTSNTVAFFATRTAGAGGGGGIFTGNGLTTTTIASTPTFTTFSILPAINSANTVSFTATPSTGGEGVFTGNGSAIGTIASTGTLVPSFAGPTAVNSSVVAFIANFSDGSQQVLIGNGSSTAPIATTGTSVPSFVGPVSMNGSNVVAFVANLAGGAQGVFAGNTSGVVNYATTGSGFSAFGNFDSINSSGMVAYAAALSGGGEGIFTGTVNGSTVNTNRVIATGTPLAGSTVQTVALGSFSFNDLGSIAFAAQLADGRQGVFVAVPVPEPMGVLTAAAVGFGAFAAIRRRNRAKFSQQY